ncbi:MAG TPA: hypothetical protein VEV38_14660 [Candidatus Eremiobacteraceae bacterium]|nr:hypothetical protein [Candidatus Eremiobacteraceae bacterium]
MRLRLVRAASSSLGAIKAALTITSGSAFLLAAAGLVISLLGVDVEQYVSATPIGFVFASLVALFALTGLVIRFTGLLTIAGDIRISWPVIPCIAAWIFAFWRAYVVMGQFGKYGGPDIINGAAVVVTPAGTRAISMVEYHQYNALSWTSTFALAAALFLTFAVLWQALSPAAVKADDSNSAETVES